MAEEVTHSYNEILTEMANEMNQIDLDSETESVQQMVELEPLLPSQPSHLSSNYLPQQQYVVEDEVIIKMEGIIKDCGDGILSPDCCIYRIPVSLFHLKEEAYTPRMISIGPFHHGNDERLQDMENHKQILFKRFTQRATSSLDDLVRCVKDLEPKVRASYYSGTITFTQQELVEIILMDAAFIIEFFITRNRDELFNDAKLSQKWLQNLIRQDLVLLENQLPFFAIEELFNKAFPDGHDRRGRLPSFLSLTYDCLRVFNEQQWKPDADVEIKHFTDLVRLFYLQGKEYMRCPSPEGPYNVNALQEAGIQLKASKSKCLLDLTFSGNILEIPPIKVEDPTEILFRNMIALEQCHYPYASYITDYAKVLDCLIDTNKDVDLLIHKKIVRNGLGDSNNVALLFNGLLINVLRSGFNFQYFDLCQRLNSYCHNPCRSKMATLTRDYCNTPWRTVASIAGIILLVLTIVQTIFSVLQVVLKKN